MSRPSLVAVAILVLAGSFAWEPRAAQGAPADDLEMEVEQLWAPPFPGCYWPAMVTLRNQGPAQELLLRVRTTSGRGHRSEDFLIAEQSVSLEPGEERRISVPVLADATPFAQIELLIDGDVTHREQLDIRYSDIYPPILVVQRDVPARAAFSRWDAQVVHLPAESLPSTWQCFSSIGGCLLDTDDLRALTPEQRTALRRWVESGGELVLHPVPDEAAELRYLEDLGWTDAGRWPREAASYQVGSRRSHSRPEYSVARRHVGSGRVILLEESAFGYAERRQYYPEWGRSEVGPNLWAQGRGSYWAGGRQLEASFTIPGVGEPPLGAFVALAVLFVVLIGPVNWYLVVRKLRTPSLFLLTTPAISLLTVLTMLGSSMLSEGTGTSARIQSLAVLDMASKRGTTWSLQAFYQAGMGSPTLVFDAATLVVPLDSNRARRAVRWNGGQELVRGWLPARQYVAFGSSSHYPARFRVDLEADGEGGFKLVNGLPRTLTKVVARAPDGTLWYGQGIASGEQGALSRQRLKIERPGKLLSYVSLPPGLANLPPGSFMANLDGPLEADVGLDDYEEVAGIHLVIGVAGGEGGG